MSALLLQSQNVSFRSIIKNYLKLRKNKFILRVVDWSVKLCTNINEMTQNFEHYRFWTFSPVTTYALSVHSG